MNVLIYRYGSICEPDIINNLKKCGFNVIEDKTKIIHKEWSAIKCIDALNENLKKYNPMFIFSINFFPIVSEVCNIHKIPYLCWTVDCPVFELFSKSIQYQTNRIFMFDKEQYNKFAPFNSDNIYYLPLASATERFDSAIQQITEKDRKKYRSDICFIGSLYAEKNPMHKIKFMSDYVSGYIDGIVEASLKMIGYNFIEDVITEEVVQELKKGDPDFYNFNNAIMDVSHYAAAHKYIGNQVSEVERIRTLNVLSQYFKVDLYTKSDSSVLKNVNVHGGIESLTEMPKAFHLSKINLNITSKSIQTGLPLRIFDIMGCGGFLMTNYQEELIDYFEIGTDLEAYSSLEELVDKCDFYLKNEDLRKQIALNGYRKVKENHTYIHRINSIIKTIL